MKRSGATSAAAASERKDVPIGALLTGRDGTGRRGGTPDISRLLAKL